MGEEAVTAGAEGGPLARGRCPRCGKAIQWAAGGGPLARGGPLAKGNLYRPFCSDRRWPFGQRCKLIDLGKWIDEEYRIASENPLPNEKEPEVALWPEGRGGGRRRWPFGQKPEVTLWS